MDVRLVDAELSAGDACRERLLVAASLPEAIECADAGEPVKAVSTA